MGVAGGLLVKVMDCGSKGPVQSHCSRDLFPFRVHSALPQKLSRFSFASVGGDVKPWVPGNLLKLAISNVNSCYLVLVCPPVKLIYDDVHSAGV